MTEEQKNHEGQNFSENSGNEEINVTAGSGNLSQDSTLEEKKTISEWNSEGDQKKKIQNLWAAVIIVAGLFLGSLFIDVSQFITKGGYSERALEKVDLFQAGDRTWVAHEGTPIELTVLVPDEEEMDECPECDPTEVIKWFKNSYLPTLVAKKVTTTSEEGKKMIKDYELKTIPSFVFDEGVTDSDFYQDPQAQAIFDEQDGKFVLNLSALGAPVGKYLEMPEMEEGDAVFGNSESETKMIIFSDFQCPYSKMFFDTAIKVMEDYKDTIAFVHKDLPLGFHPQAQNAALAARCAQEQDKFWEMSEVLYADQGVKEKTSAWDNQEGVKVFSTYAQKISLNVVDFEACMAEGTPLAKINMDIALAGEFGISGTPSGFIGDEFLGGVAQEEQLRKIFDEQIAKNK